MSENSGWRRPLGRGLWGALGSRDLWYPLYILITCELCRSFVSQDTRKKLAKDTLFHHSLPYQTFSSRNFLHISSMPRTLARLQRKCHEQPIQQAPKMQAWWGWVWEPGSERVIRLAKVLKASLRQGRVWGQEGQREESRITSTAVVERYKRACLI